MNKLTKFIILVVAVLGSACSSRQTLHIYSPDEDQCVTVMTVNHTTMYIMNGAVEKVPNTDYLKLDLSNRDLEVEDYMHICWEETGDYKWKMVVSNSMILEQKLDTNLYKFKTELPLRDFGIPTEIDFRKENCAVISLPDESTSPKSKTIVISK